jgi:predicted transcriptional regulator
MTTTQIMLAPRELMGQWYFTKDAQSLALQHLNQYTTMPAIQVAETGQDAAEEMFDLTNNPSRQRERLTLYGNHRSLSVGDIVQVDNTRYLCLSQGWSTI